ncbi:MAG: hypothetical protein M1825_000982 [Sarcosagium campestre]|nr:MAG: hypothetical protein M1825_000982 [Sarcosagium campestre]
MDPPAPIDPWDWTVDDVVNYLCLPQASWSGSNAPNDLPGSSFLETALRGNAISGWVLLSQVDDSALYSFGIHAFGHRANLKRAIGHLQSISPKYEHDARRLAARNLPQSVHSNATLSPVLAGSQSSPATPGLRFSDTPISRSFAQGTNGGIKTVSQTLAHGLSGNAGLAIRHVPTGLEQVPAPLEASNDAYVAVDSDPARSPEPDNSELNQSQTAAGDVESSELPRKRARIAPTQIDPSDFFDSLGPSEEDENSLRDGAIPNEIARSDAEPQVSDTIIRSSILQGMKQRLRQTLTQRDLSPVGGAFAIQSEPPVKSSNQVETVGKPLAQEMETPRLAVISKKKRRLAPTLIPDENYFAPDLQGSNATSDSGDDASSEKSLQKPSGKIQGERSPRGQQQAHRNNPVGYLGKCAWTVDNLFYGSTAFGGVITHRDREDADLLRTESDSDVFSFIRTKPRIIGSSRFANARMKYFFNQADYIPGIIDDVSFVGVLPYPAHVSLKYTRRSFTKFTADDNARLLAIRGDLSTWPDAVDQTSKVTSLLDGGDLLDSMESRHVDTSIYPLYGESCSDGEYSTDTWNDIQAETGGALQPIGGPRKRKTLTVDDVKNAIKEGQEDIVDRWRQKTLPRLELTSLAVWSKATRQKSRSRQIGKGKSEIDHINRVRLPKQEREILKDTFTSSVQVRKVCRNMEQSIHDRERLAWTISILEREDPPPRPPQGIEPVKAARRAQTAATTDGEEEDILPSDADDVPDADEKDDSLVGFIVDDGDTDINSYDTELSRGLTNAVASSSSASPSHCNRPKTPPKTIRISQEPLQDDDSSDDEPLANTTRHTRSQIVVVSPSPPEQDPNSQTLQGRQNRPRLRTRLPSPPGLIDLTVDSDEGIRTPPINGAADNAFLSLARPRALSIDSEQSDDFRTPQAGAPLAKGETGGERSFKKRKRPVKRDFEAMQRRHEDERRMERQQELRRSIPKAVKALVGATQDIEAYPKILVNPLGAGDDKDSDTTSHVYLPAHIARKVKDHQVNGISFLWRETMHDNGGDSPQGCLLAHTMGLGKTMQVISLLLTIRSVVRSNVEKQVNQLPLHLRESRTLILCPPTLIDNWQDEIDIWAPPSSEAGIGPVIKLEANVKSRLLQIEGWYRNGGILIMSYDMFRVMIENKGSKSRDPPLREEQHRHVRKQLLEGPSIIVADEAHKLKNPGSAISIAASQFSPSGRRIALTGSPLANNLEEYYRMINWVCPGYLGAVDEFKDWYQEPIEEGLYSDASAQVQRLGKVRLEALSRAVAPKVDRVDVSVLRDDLPPKTEFLITVPLTDIQNKAYALFVNRMLKGGVEQLPIVRLFAWLSVLSLLCNHPVSFRNKLLERRQPKRTGLKSALPNDGSVGIVDDDVVEDVSANVTFKELPDGLVDDLLSLLDESGSNLNHAYHSYKALLFDRILDLAAKVGDKTLVFSHHLATLDYLEERFKKSKRKYARLDGKVKISMRQGNTKRFNDPNSSVDVYLISTRAGGLGLNMIGANRVVLFDFHFNPTWEEQAIGRAYRYGQRKPVYVYYLTVGETFEGVMHNKAIFKMQLATRVVDKKNPERYAVKKLSDYLFVPKEPEQSDLSEFQGKDKGVLDKVLAGTRYIRSIKLTETFQKHSNEALTTEERKAADEFYEKMENLRHTGRMEIRDAETAPNTTLGPNPLAPAAAAAPQVEASACQTQ